MSLNSESAEIHIKMHSVATHYRQTPQTSEAKPFSERKSPEQQDLLKAQKRKYFETLSSSFFYVFQAEQSKTVDSPNTPTPLGGLLRVTEEADPVTGTYLGAMGTAENP